MRKAVFLVLLVGLFSCGDSPSRAKGDVAGWTLQRNIDPLDGHPKDVSLSLWSERGPHGERGQLVLYCDYESKKSQRHPDGGLGVILLPHPPAKYEVLTQTSHEDSVRWRFDGGTTGGEWWPTVDGHPGAWGHETWMRRLAQANATDIEYFSEQHSSIVLHFDVTGLASQLDAVLSGCPNTKDFPPQN
jgi:hypothetical protein